MSGCPEIQGLWRPQEGDCIFIKGHSYTLPHVALIYEGLRGGLIVGRGWEEDWEFEREVSTWLPRQDQLQEIWWKSTPDGTYLKLWTMVEEFYGHYERYGYPKYAFSMEQLWLAFVMKELYNKIWDGDNWK